MANDASKQFSQLSHDFNKVVEELKGTSPLLEELVARGGKLQRHFDATSSALLGFLEAIQKVADVAGAASAYGGASDLGTCLTKIALRHRAIAEQYGALSSTIGEGLCKSLVTRMELRRKTLLAVEKEHDKDYKRWKIDLKKRNESNLKLANKATAKKKSEKTAGIHEKLEESLEDSVELYEDFQTFEQSSLRRVLIEERKHYAAILNALTPMMESEVRLLDEVYHLQELSAHCKSVTTEPLPAHSEQAINTLQLDLRRLFKEAPCESPALEQARKANAKKRNSFLSLTSDALSLDTVSLNSSILPTIHSDNTSAAISEGTDVSSPSLSAVRLDPDGCPGSIHTPEPMYADIEGMQDICTPVAKPQPAFAADAVSSDSRSSGGSTSELHSRSKSSLGNQPINPFGRPTAGPAPDSISLMSTSAGHSTLNRQSAKDSLAQLAKVIPPVAPKPPSARAGSVQATDGYNPGEVVYATAGDPQPDNDWPSPPGTDDLPSPPPFDDLLVDEPTPVKHAPPPVLSKPQSARQKVFAQNRMSQSLDVLYSQTRAALQHQIPGPGQHEQPIAEPADFDDGFPPPPPPDDSIYDEVSEATAASAAIIASAASTGLPYSASSDNVKRKFPASATLPASASFSMAHNSSAPSPLLQHRERSGTDSATLTRSHRLPAPQQQAQQWQERPRSSSRPLESTHTISMDV